MKPADRDRLKQAARAAVLGLLGGIVYAGFFFLLYLTWRVV